MTQPVGALAALLSPESAAVVGAGIELNPVLVHAAGCTVADALLVPLPA